MWGLGVYEWEQHFPDKQNPPFFLADVLHALQPTAKITVILRDPVEKYVKVLNFTNSFVFINDI